MLFLGNDEWGKKAVLENEDALIFSRIFTEKEIVVSEIVKEGLKERINEGAMFASWREGDENVAIQLENIVRWNSDSTKIVIQEESLGVNSSEPLMIDLPLLGYNLQVTQLDFTTQYINCLLYTSPSPRDRQKSRMPSSA